MVKRKGVLYIYCHYMELRAIKNVNWNTKFTVITVIEWATLIWTALVIQMPWWRAQLH